MPGVMRRSYLQPGGAAVCSCKEVVTRAAFVSIVNIRCLNDRHARQKRKYVVEKVTFFRDLGHKVKVSYILCSLGMKRNVLSLDI